MSKKHSNRKKCDNFSTAWERRERWTEQAQCQLPDDATIKKMAAFACCQPQDNDAPLPYLPARSHRWMGYAAAATLVAGISIIGVTHNNGTNNSQKVKEVNIGGQTIHFVCNNDCSVQDVLLASQEVLY